MPPAEPARLSVVRCEYIPTTAEVLVLSEPTRGTLAKCG